MERLYEANVEGKEDTLHIFPVDESNWHLFAVTYASSVVSTVIFSQSSVTNKRRREPHLNYVTNEGGKKCWSVRREIILSDKLCLGISSRWRTTRRLVIEANDWIYRWFKSPVSRILTAKRRVSGIFQICQSFYCVVTPKFVRYEGIPPRTSNVLTKLVPFRCEKKIDKTHQILLTRIFTASS